MFLMSAMKRMRLSVRLGEVAEDHFDFEDRRSFIGWRSRHRILEYLLLYCQYDKMDVSIDGLSILRCENPSLGNPKPYLCTSPLSLVVSESQNWQIEYWDCIMSDQKPIYTEHIANGDTTDSM